MVTDKIYVPHHLGMGDAIICNGLIRYLLQLNQVVYIPVLSIFEQSVRFMYRDIQEGRVRFIVVPPSDNQYNYIFSEVRKFLKDIHQFNVGFALNRNGIYQNLTKKYGLSGVYYQALNLSSDLQYSYYQCDRDLERQEKLYNHLVGDCGQYVFFHDDKQRQLVIQNFNCPYKIIQPDPVYTNNIFDYSKIIENAKQLHMIDSCFALLADHLDIQNIAVKNIYKYMRPQQLVAQTKYINDFKLIWNKQ